MIVGSFDTDKVVALCKPYQHAVHSITTYDIENHGMFSVNRGRGELDYSRLNNRDDFYWIVYLQTIPTKRNIQPAYTGEQTYEREYAEHWMWFNGKLNQDGIYKIQVEEDILDDWEPMLMLKHIIRYGSVADIDGAFSCVYSNGKSIYTFRNENEVMFYDDDLTICTSPFPGSKTLPVNKLFKLDLEKKKMKVIDEFSTVRKWC